MMIVLTAICLGSVCSIQPNQAPMPDMETCAKVADFRNAMPNNGGVKWTCALTYVDQGTRK